jgi:hypothetical protein
MDKIMEIAAAQTCGDDLLLNVACYRGPYIAILDADVARVIGTRSGCLLNKVDIKRFVHICQTKKR